MNDDREVWKMWSVMFLVGVCLGCALVYGALTVIHLVLH